MVKKTGLEGMSPDDAATFPGGLDWLRMMREPRVLPFTEVEAALPPPDVDFAPLKTALVPPQATPVTKARKAADKALRIAEEFAGQPQLLTLNALLIAIQRRIEPPQRAIDLFQRLWREEADWLIANHRTRWLISSAATFRDCGVNEAQRRTGLTLAMLFNLIKLHEVERLFSGLDPAQVHRLGDRVSAPIALDMGFYSLTNGDLDRNLFHDIWENCVATDPVLRPLAVHLIEALNGDRRTVFARLKQVKMQKFGIATGSDGDD